jgi:Lrp/AsnC family leucine-responsive transcriptional regulator
VTLDEKDRAILDVLLRDGRASLRKVALLTGLSTPTVSQKLTRLTQGGVIKGFSVRLSADSYSGSAIIRLAVPPAKLDEFARSIAFEEAVCYVLATTGEANLMLGVALAHPKELPDLIAGILSRFPNVKHIDSEIVTRVYKDEHPPISAVAETRLVCDLCGGIVTSKRVYRLKVGHGERRFCCKTCRSQYIAKYSGRLTKLTDVSNLP